MIMKGNFGVIVSIVLIVILIAAIFVGCGTDDKLAADVSQRFIKVSSKGNLTDYCYAVYVDSETRVMYLVISGGSSAGITAILNGDGTPMLYDGILE